MKTRKSDRLFATSYYTKIEQNAQQRCKAKNCDIIIKWTKTRPNGTQYSGYDIGSFTTDADQSSACPQNPDMDAIVIWQKTPTTSTTTTPTTSTSSTLTASTADPYNYY